MPRPCVDIGSLIRCFSDGTITKTYHVAGKYEKGRWIEGEERQEEIIASIQPMTGDELQLLPETYRLRNTIKIYSLSPLFPGSAKEGRAPDSIIWQGRKYEIFSVEDWSAHGSYWKGLAVLEAQDQ